MGGIIKMENKKILGIFAFAMIALLGVGFAAAYQGDYSVEGPDYSEERHDVMQEAFDNTDYDAWATLMIEDGKTPGVLRFVNEDNFEVFVEAHEAGTTGDSARASELRAQLGLGQGSKSGNGEGQGSQKGSGMGGQAGNGMGRYAA